MKKNIFLIVRHDFLQNKSLGFSLVEAMVSMLLFAFFIASTMTALKGATFLQISSRDQVRYVVATSSIKGYVEKYLTDNSIANAEVVMAGDSSSLGETLKGVKSDLETNVNRSLSIKVTMTPENVASARANNKNGVLFKNYVSILDGKNNVIFDRMFVYQRAAQ